MRIDLSDHAHRVERDLRPYVRAIGLVIVSPTSAATHRRGDGAEFEPRAGLAMAGCTCLARSLLHILRRCFHSNLHTSSKGHY